MNTNAQQSNGLQWFRRPVNLTLLGFLAISAFFLFSEHRAHFFGALPYLLLLACPLLHLFGHSGRKGHRHREPDPGQRHSHLKGDRP
jgi:hypothetical protein